MLSRKRKGSRARWVLTPAQRKQQQEARRRALHALSLTRRGMSTSKAARVAGTTIRNIRHHVGTAVEQLPTGRYRAKPFDRMKRPMKVPTEWGPVTLDIRDSRKASELGRFWPAAHYYLRTGIDSRLRRFRGKGVRVAGQFYPYITDLPTLERLAQAGEISFEDIYESIV